MNSELDSSASVSAAAAPRAWPDYRAVWRWHFYAGLICTPFVLVLSLTGAIYLFKPQVEAWNDRAYDNLVVTGQPSTAADQVRAALAAVPDSAPTGYEIPPEPGSAARVLVRQGSETIRVYVHPENLSVLHTVAENDRFMRILFRLHGELGMGDRGSNLVELAASWTIVLIVTGLYLWWPRNASGLGGVVYPRFGKVSRIFWRDLHAVTGIWISALALLLLASGLPWAKFWGTYFKSVRQVTGTAVVQQDWTVGSDRAASARRPASDDHSGHGGGSGGRRGGGKPEIPKDLEAFDRIMATVRPLQLAEPVVIAPPARGSTDWTAKSMAANRPLRVNLVMNGTTGEIVSREDFRDRHWIDQVVGYGIAAHEGQLFGWPNQLLGLLTAAGLVLLCVSGLILWWRRRDAGILGAPKILMTPRLSASLLAIVILLGVYLPLFGLSLIGVLLIERILLCRVEPVRHWLGLRPPAGRLAT